MSTAAGSMDADGRLATEVLHKYACVLCQQRKVKCDRNEPCAGCQKAQKPCVFAPRKQPKKRPRKATELGLHARVRRYEQLLTKFGVNIEDVAADSDCTIESTLSTESVQADQDRSLQPGGPQGLMEFDDIFPGTRRDNDDSWPHNTGRSKLITTKNGSARYLEIGLWKSISEEFAQPEEDQEESDDGEQFLDPQLSQDGLSAIIFGQVGDSVNLEAFLPRPDIAMRLWRVFKENVDPLLKLFHAPTVEKMLQKYFDGHRSVDIPKGDIALAFSIFLFAITTLSSDETRAVTGEPLAAVAMRYGEATKTALTRASLLRTLDLTVLQAYTLFLLAVRRVYDPQTLWTLSGVALRIANRMGLHLDGEGSSISPFQIEMRRRTWWQVFFLDRTAAEASGAGILTTRHYWNTRVPLNVNDSDLDPDMKELPNDREGATDVIFPRMRYELPEFVKESGRQNFDAAWHGLTGPRASLAAKDRAINEITNRYESKFLKYCDPLKPLHFMVQVVARSALCFLYLITHHPRNYPDKGQHMSQEEKDTLFDKALKIVEYYNLVHASQNMQGFLWHMNFLYAWKALFYLLDFISAAPLGPQAGRVWEQLAQMFEHNPTLLTEKSNGLHAAVLRLTLLSWDTRERSLIQQGQSLQDPPDFIKSLRRVLSAPRKDTNRPTGRMQNPENPLGHNISAHECMAENPGARFQSPSNSADATSYMLGDFGTFPADLDLWDEPVGNFEWQNFDPSSMFNYDSYPYPLT